MLLRFDAVCQTLQRATLKKQKDDLLLHENCDDISSRTCDMATPQEDSPCEPTFLYTKRRKHVFTFTFPWFAGVTRVLLAAPHIVPAGEHLNGAQWGSHVCPPTKKNHHTAQHQELPGVKSRLPKQWAQL